VIHLEGDKLDYSEICFEDYWKKEQRGCGVIERG
jgi:hypothetical protein